MDTSFSVTSFPCISSEHFDGLHGNIDGILVHDGQDSTTTLRLGARARKHTVLPAETNTTWRAKPTETLNAAATSLIV